MIAARYQIYDLNIPTIFSIDKVELQYRCWIILEFPMFTCSCSLFNNRKSTQQNKKTELNILSATGMFMYILTWFIFLKKFVIFIMKINVKNLIYDIDKRTVIRVAQLT